MIVISGTAPVRPDRLKEATAAAIEMARMSRAEPGCVIYEVSSTLEDPRTFRLVEQWDSQDALDAHFRTPHFADFSAKLAGFLAGAPAFTRYVVASAGPL